MFKGLGQMGDMAKMMSKAKEMQDRLVELQAQMDETEITGESGAGLVRATVTLKGQLKGVDIDPSIFTAEEKEVAEDLIVAAITDAQAKGRAEAEKQMSALTEEMGLPAGMKMPF